MPCSELAKLINDMSLELAEREGLKTIDDITDRLRESIPTIQRENVVDALVAANRRPRGEVTELRRSLNQIKQEARSDQALRNKIDELQANLEQGTIPPGRTFREPTNAIKQLRSIRDDLRKKLRKSEPAVRQRLERQIAKLNEQIEQGVELPQPKQKPKLSAELEDLQFERDRLRAQIRQEINALKPKTVWEKIRQPFDTARTIMVSYDLSALRQAAPVLFSRPIQTTKNIPKLFKAFASEKAAQKTMKEIMESPNARLYERSGLHISPLDGPLLQREEMYRSRWAEKVPGVRASERAFTVFLNKIRADTFDALSSTLAKNGDPTQQEFEAIANLVNVMTGRGSLGAAERWAGGLNTIFFAPKYVVSRFQLIAGQPLLKRQTPARVRKLIALEYGRMLAGMGVTYGLLDAAGFKIEFDPRSSDFGKIRVGNTRLDPMGGLLQVSTLIGRVGKGETKRLSTGEIVPIRGEGVPFGGDDTFDVMSRFMRTKLSPQFGVAVNVLTGKNVVGEEVTPKSQAVNMAPLTIREIFEAMQEQGVPKGAAMGLLAILGVGLQTFDPNENGRRRSRRVR